MNDTKLSHYLIPIAIVLAGGLVVLAVWSQGPSEEVAEDGNDAPIEVGVGNLPVMGDENAPITLVEFSDFGCSHCAGFFNVTETKLRDEFIASGQLKMYWRDFAFLGPDSERAANAARCANEQGEFWAYHDLLFNAQGTEDGFEKDNLKALGAELELDKDEFSQCVDTNRYRDDVQDDTKEGRDLDVQGTPTVFINGERIVGNQPYGVFENIINEILGELE